MFKLLNSPLTGNERTLLLETLIISLTFIALDLIDMLKKVQITVSIVTTPQNQ